MADQILITDEQLLALGLAAEALAGVALAVRTEHRATASGIALASLGVRFEIPSDWTPGPDVRAVVAHIAAASALGRRGYNPQARSSDPIAARGAAAEAWLQRVVDGDVRPLNVEGLTERRGPQVAGTRSSAWDWRRSTTGGRSGFGG